MGPYEVLSAIGAGGMGEVYLARDTKLGRDVALKVLPEAFAASTERLARFQREAQTLASLNHPHIAAIYGIEEGPTGSALVLELVEGPTLADRIAARRLSLQETLSIARQAGEALEAAHERGIVHRDLKPANIKVRDDGTVKVLDFGLAKLTTPFEPAPGGAAHSISPTITSPVVTQTGVLLGSAAYMSPEQARGKAVDKRADVWAFGCVVYEMLTGVRAFDGPEVADALALVLTKEPDWTKLPRSTPSALRRMLRRCLAKDPRDRMRDIGDALLDIREAATTRHTDAPSPAAQQRPMWIVGAIAAGLVILVATAFVTYAWLTPVENHPTTRFPVVLPSGYEVTRTGGSTSIGAGGSGPAPLAVSPDGRHIAFLANTTSGLSQIWIRTLDTIEARPLAGTEGALSPFWSPDSEHVGFFAEGRLKRIAINGGRALTLCEASDFRGGTWSRDDVIVFSGAANAGLSRVSGSGGVPVQATMLQPGEGRHQRPAFLPDGRHFIYAASGTGLMLSGVYAGSLDSSDRKLIFELPDASNVAYAQGHLLFMRETTLMAQPFDIGTLALSGEALPIAEDVQTLGANQPVGVFSVSDNGVLAYQQRVLLGVELTWFDRRGARVATLAESGQYADVEVSPDGERTVVSVLEGRQRDLWIFDNSRRSRLRLTSGPGTELQSRWSRDGRRIAFSSRPQQGGRLDLYVKASDGSGPEELWVQSDRDKFPTSWSPDDRLLAFVTTGGPGRDDMWIVATSGERKPSPLLHTGFNERYPMISPDGRWVAYVSDESGRREVYVGAFPELQARTPVSVSGGDTPRWRKDGSEIVYLVDRTLTAAPISVSRDRLQVGQPKPLFEVPGLFNARSGGYAWDMTPDGQRFLISVIPQPASDQMAINVVLNWANALKK